MPFGPDAVILEFYYLHLQEVSVCAHVFVHNYFYMHVHENVLAFHVFVSECTPVCI